MPLSESPTQYIVMKKISLLLLFYFCEFQTKRLREKNHRLAKPTDSYPSALSFPETNVLVKSFMRCNVRFDGESFLYSFLSC